MMLHRSWISRFVATTVAIALTAQLAGAQFAGCLSMNESSPAGEHAAMTADHQTHTAQTIAVTALGDTRQGNATVPACSQTLLCANAPAIPVAELHAVSPNPPSAPIASAAATFEALTLRPESPPPKS